MAKSKLVQANKGIAEDVAQGFRGITDAVVDGYRKIENGAVGGYAKIEDRFVDQFLTRDGETVADAKARLKKEQVDRQGK